MDPYSKITLDILEEPKKFYFILTLKLKLNITRKFSKVTLYLTEKIKTYTR